MATIDTWLLAGAVVCAAGVGALQCGPRRTRPQVTHRASKRTPAVVGNVPARRQVAPPTAQHLAVLDHASLIAATGLAGRIERIRTSLGFAPENWARDVEPLLQRFTEFVQLLPASESHHHAQPGGLIAHGFEVADYAVHARNAWRLPLGADAQEQLQHAARYSYAVLIAALLHDIGKVIADLKVEVLVGQNTQPWVPLGGSMEAQGAAWYSVSFPEPSERNYRAHTRLACMLIQPMVPSTALAWLAQYPPIVEELHAYLGGESSEGRAGSRNNDAPAGDEIGPVTRSAIHRIVSDADRRSVAENLKYGSRTRFATARTVPLIERLMEALRRLLADGGLALNRAGAVGYCDGESLWFVAGTIAEAVRKYLADNEIRETGAAGVPADNNRLFDIWQEYAALVPARDGGAIWTVNVSIGEWRQCFTVLRFPLSKLYADPARYPQPLPTGAIVPNAAETPVDTADAADAIAGREATTAEQESCEESGPTEMQGPGGGNRIGEPDAERTVAEQCSAGAASEVIDLRHAPTDASARVSPRDDADAACEQPVYLPDAETASALLEDDQPGRSARSEVPTQLREPVRPKQKARRLHASGADVMGRAKPRPNAERFLAWVQEGVASGELAYNESKARVHFVPEGMLLVTPGIFKDYASEHPDVIEIESTDDGKEPERWKIVQRDFQKSGYPVPGEPIGATGAGQRVARSFLLHYNIKGAGGRQLMVMRVPEPERFFNPVPPANALIQSKQVDDVVSERGQS